MAKGEKFSTGDFPPHSQQMYQSDNTVYPQTFWSYPFLLMFCNHKETVTVPCETKPVNGEILRCEYEVCANCGKLRGYKFI